MASSYFQWSPLEDLELGLRALHQWPDEENNKWTQRLDPKSLQCAPLRNKPDISFFFSLKIPFQPGNIQGRSTRAWWVVLTMSNTKTNRGRKKKKTPGDLEHHVNEQENLVCRRQFWWCMVWWASAAPSCPWCPAPPLPSLPLSAGSTPTTRPDMLLIQTISLFDPALTNVLPSAPPGSNSLQGRGVHSAAESSAT